MNSNNATATVNQEFLADAISGLSKTNKVLHCKYFYDQRGSQLFDQICALPEYYLTRTESEIMSRYIDEMSAQLGEQIMLVEFGSGSSTKTRFLLDALVDPVAYVPVDISETHLLETAAELRADYPGIDILPLVGDFTKPFQLPISNRPVSHAAVFFPGSTIGNFVPSAAVDMLTSIAQVLGTDGGMLIGIDLQKDPAVIEAAYNDAQGVTDEFNLNVLHRLNRELGADFNVGQFMHKATYNEKLGRVEIYIVSRVEQLVTIGEHQFKFHADEPILTEYSHKYTVESFQQLAAPAGFQLHQQWTDSERLFAVLHLVNEK